VELRKVLYILAAKNYTVVAVVFLRQLTVLTVLRDRIRIQMFSCLPGPDAEPLVRGTDPDPSVIKQKL
jgi:hypothetical protein